QWAKEFEQLPALEHLVRDGGKGLQNGLARVNEKRRKEKKPLVGDQLDNFHTLREGRRGVRKMQSQAERAWTAAEEAEKKVRKRHRHGQAKTGYKTQAVLKWQKAEETFHQWEDAERAVEEIRLALRPFTPQGELNTREKAQQAIEAVLAKLAAEHFDKF